MRWPPSPGDYNELAEASERRVTSSGAPVLQGPSGFVLKPPAPVFIDAETVGVADTGGLYAWREIYRDSDSGTWTVLADGRSGTTDELPAIERNAVEALAEGTRVRLELDPSEEFYVFDAGGGPATDLADDQTAWSVTQNNWVPTGVNPIKMITPSGAGLSLTGIDTSGYPEGFYLTLINASPTYTFSIADSDTGSDADFRFALAGGGDAPVLPGEAVRLWRSPSGGWRIVGTAPARPSIGSTGQFLTVDTSQPSQTKWADAPGGKYESYYRYDSTATVKCWYPGGNVVGQTGSTALSADTIYALPFVVAKACTADRLAVDVTTSTAGGKARVAIYSNLGETTPAPDAKAVDSGELDCSSTGLKTATISQALTANTLYWLALVVNSAAIELRGVAYDKGHLWNILGFGESGGALTAGGGVGWTQGFAFAALPATASPSARIEPTTGSAVPLGFLRIT